MRTVICGFCMLFFFSAGAMASESDEIAHSTLSFGATIDEKCDDQVYSSSESGLATTLVTKFAVDAVKGFASALLSKAVESRDNLRRSVVATGNMYYWSDRSKKWKLNEQCIRFWYANRSSSLTEDGSKPLYGAPPVGQETTWNSMTTRWKSLGFSARPYLYSEVRLIAGVDGNAAVLKPVVLFARKPPEGTGIFRSISEMTVAIDLKLLSQEEAFGTYFIKLPDVSRGAVFVHGKQAIVGFSSSDWFVVPAPPLEAPSGNVKDTVPFSANVAYVTNTDGSIFGKSVSNAFNSTIDKLPDIQSKSEKEQAKQSKILEAFDAIAEVDAAQQQFDDASPGEKAKYATLLKKTKFIADSKLTAAGLQPRYGVVSP